MKRRIVMGLDSACTLLHPILHRWPFYRCVLAGWSARLEERWNTGCWDEHNA